jgi:uncharacterized protein YfaS (alpha-2-macroglobulin family)
MIKQKYLWVLLLCLVMMAVSCRDSSSQGSAGKKLADDGTEWYRYISAHTTGGISRKSRIKVLFVNPVGKKGESSAALDSVFKFKPDIQGKAVWENDRELSFIPKVDLEQGKEYQVVLNLKNIMNTIKPMGNFSFGFSVINADFEMELEGIMADEESKAADRQLIRGKIITADFEENLLIEKMVTAKQDGADLQINWNHNPEKKSHDFLIRQIVRQAKESRVVLAWDGRVIGVNNRGEREITVIPLGEFNVVYVQAVNDDQQSILVQFSDALEKNQNLTGLIQVKDYQVTHEIDGNFLRIYSNNRFSDTVDIQINAGIKNNLGRKIKNSSSHSVFFATVNPAVRFAGKGTILPENDQLLIPIEAVNLHSVQVTALQVYSNNMSQFLQVNNWQGNEELLRVGRFLWRKTIPLSTDRKVTNQWSHYHLDVTSLLKNHPGSLFRLILSFNRKNSAFPCGSNSNPPIQEPPFANSESYDFSERSNWDYFDQPENQSSYEFLQRNNPCHDAYYNPAYNGEKVKAERNFIASNIGLIAKSGDFDLLTVAATDIAHAQHIAGVKIKVFNFQNQSIGEGLTDVSGLAEISLSGKPFYLRAEKNNDVGYLKVNNETALPDSHFDVAGEKIVAGVKGTIYGERGVWRPGDDIHLTLVIHDPKKTIPADHPVIMEFYNPSGQLVSSCKPLKSMHPFHSFRLHTADSAPTGNWKVQALIGGLTFKKTIKIETIVPNRLKIQFDLAKEMITLKDLPLTATLSSQWLHGATAANLKSDVMVRYNPLTTAFNRYGDYQFDDPAKSFVGGDHTIFEGYLDQTGSAAVQIKLQTDKKSPGLLQATFFTRVFEEAGGFSMDQFSIPFHPYASYVGLKMPKGDEARGMLLTDQLHTLDIVTVTPQGDTVDRDKLEIFLYKIDWKWWWDKSGDSLAQYASDSFVNVLQKGEIHTRQGLGKWQFQVKYPDWGRYLIRVVDPVSGHSTGKVFYMDWPGWAGRAREEKGAGATRLNFSSDKSLYQVGEKAVIFLPKSVQGSALVTLENGSGIIKQFWQKINAGDNRFEIDLTAAMVPNIYVHAMLLQPHQNKTSDVPIRVYGILPIMVENPETKLQPQIQTAAEFKPDQDMTIMVSEKNKRSMTYTLAVVDEGLLGLTRFKTPNLHQEFYRKEALGVKTWDVFDDVVGAYGAELSRILALGGDEDGFGGNIEPPKKKRFPPVVLTAGPFALAEGKTNTHVLKMPAYIGEVRIMAVAGNDGAYGWCERSVPVRQDLMLLMHCPRVIRPGEEIDVPVTVFAMNPDLKEVKLTLQTHDLLTEINGKQQSLSFSQPGEKIAFFQVKVAATLGKASLKCLAKSGQYSAEQEIYMDILAANPPTARIDSLKIDGRQQSEIKMVPFGLKNTNEITLECSIVPPLNIDQRLGELIHYPHGCLEQTISAAFPQLYVNHLYKLTADQQNKIKLHITAAIEKLTSFQSASGGFSFWPGEQTADAWAGNYAGHFLIEAKNAGYFIPPSLLAHWLNDQKSRANFWTTGDIHANLTQAFRLYLLALAKNADLGAMNRLRESANLSAPAAMQLAAAFSLAGQTEAALDLLHKTDLHIESYRTLSGTFGSYLRDKAILLQTLVLLKKNDRADALVAEISQILSSDAWLSTQECAFALMALAKYYAASEGQKIEFALSSNHHKEQSFQFTSHFFQHSITPIPNSGLTLKIENKNDKPLFAVIINKGVAPAGQEKEENSQLTLQVTYYDLKNVPIAVSEIKQGNDFVAEIKLANQSGALQENLALSHIFASGWQIVQPCFDHEHGKNDAFDYQDVRDDRIYTYFSLPPRAVKQFRVLLNASYPGKFYLPGVAVNAMYDGTIFSSIKGQWVQVIQ